MDVPLNPGVHPGPGGMESLTSSADPEHQGRHGRGPSNLFGCASGLSRLSPLAWIIIATFFHFGSLYCLLPTLPLYVLSLGGTTYDVGLVVGAFSLASLLVRRSSESGWT